jgi:hypothetical protein
MLELKFNKYWKMFHNYILNENIIFFIKKPFKEFEFIYFQPTRIFNYIYNNIKYEYLYFFTNDEYNDPGFYYTQVSIETEVMNSFIELINEDLSTKYNRRNIRFKYLNLQELNSYNNRYYLLGFIDYNIFLLKHYWNNKDYYECINLFKSIDKENFIISFEELYFKDIC